MKTDLDDARFLDQARSAAERLLVNLKLRRDDLAIKGNAHGRELVDRTVRAVENVHEAIERSLGGFKDHQKSQDKL